jgi:hypothetical protein
MAQRVPRQFAQGTGELDPGGSCAHDKERQEGLSGLAVCFSLRCLEREQHPTPDLDRIFDRLQAGCTLFPFVMSKVVVADARRDDDRVVADCGAVRQMECPRGRVEARDVGEPDSRIALSPENPAKGRDDVAGGKAASCDLVEQGLKEMDVTAVDQGHPHPCTPQPQGRIEAPEPAADDDNVRGLRHGW